jgi:hypothetical protein
MHIYPIPPPNHFFLIKPKPRAMFTLFHDFYRAVAAELLCKLRISENPKCWLKRALKGEMVGHVTYKIVLL